MNKIEPELRHKTGIYMFFNIISGKKYIGSSIDIYNRIHEHIHNLKYGRSHNAHFLASWNKYGEDAFIYCVLEYCSKEIRFEREQYYISTLKPEYNLTLNVVANFGHKLSIETRLKISNTLKRRYAAGEIETYRQQHLWKTIYIYNIYNKTLAAKCKNQKEAFSLLKNKHKHVDKFKIYNLKYCLSYTEFVYVNDLTNYINKNLFTANSTFGKYIILESKDGELLYCRNLSECELICEKNKSTLSKHRNATKNNPYIIRENGFKFYYSNLYIPINIDTAVLVEKSLELQSGNIGEVCKDNTEINSEISQGSESSYSVGFE